MTNPDFASTVVALTCFFPFSTLPPGEVDIFISPSRTSMITPQAIIDLKTEPSISCILFLVT